MSAKPWDPVLAPFYRLYVFADDTKTQLITTKKINNTIFDMPITRIMNVKRTQTLMQPEQHSFTFAITDPRTGVFAPQTGQQTGVTGFNKGSYYELYVGKDQPAGSIVTDNNSASATHKATWVTFSYAADSAHRRPWITGYVQDITRTATKGGQFDVTGASSMIWLANFRNLNTLEMDFKTDNSAKRGFTSSYMNVMYALNGLNGGGGMGGPEVAQGPHMKGMLTGTGWKAVWVDRNKKVDPSVNFKSIAGYGDSWYTAWETVLSNLQTIAQHYNLFFREGDYQGRNSLGHHGTLEFGPLNDSSNITIWGGKELDTLLLDPSYNQPISGGGLNNTTEGNSMDAAEYTNSLSVIQAAQFEDKMDHIINLVWPLGHGGSGNNLITIQPFFHPLEDKYHKVNAHSTINGPLSYDWIDLTNLNFDQSKMVLPGTSTSVIGAVDPNEQGLHDYYWRWRPSSGSRIYYLMKTFTIGAKTYKGMVAGWDTNPANGPIVLYQLVAAQNQDGTWAYGILELNSAMKYGIHEYVLTHDKKILDPNLLLSAAIGNAENSAETVPSWTFPVKHPVDPVTGLPSPSSGTGSSDAPAFAKVGQTLDVRFTGYVYESIEQGQDGQWYGEGKSFDYLHFPTLNEYSYYDSNGTLQTLPNGDIDQVVNGLVIDKHMLDKITRIEQIDEQWTGQVYDVTYTMGKGKWRKSHWADVIAKRFENQVTSPPRPYPQRHLKHERLDGIPFIFEFGAHLDGEEHTIFLPSSGSLNGKDPSVPGGIAVSDVEHDHFFDDSHKVQYSVVAERGDIVVDFWFHKPLTHHLADIQVNANDAYGIFRLGFSNIGVGGKPIKDGTSSGKKSGFYVSKTDATGNIVNEIKVGLNHGGHNTSYGKLDINTIYHVTLQWHNGIHKAFVTNKSVRGDHHELVATWEDMGGKNSTPLLVDMDYNQNPPKPIIDKRTGKRQSQFGAIGWRCFGGDGKKGAKIFNIHAHPLKNSLGIHSVGEVRPDGSQAPIVNTHVPVGSGTGIIENGASEASTPEQQISAQTQINMGGDTYTFGKMLTGTYPAKMILTAPLTSENRTVLFNNFIIPAQADSDNDHGPLKYKGLPEAAMPHVLANGSQITITSNVFDDNNQLISEIIDLPKGTQLDLIKVDNFSELDPWYCGFYLPGDYVLDNDNYPAGSVVSWLHTSHGGNIHQHYYKGEHMITDYSTGKKYPESGWATVVETVNGRGRLVLFADGHLGWDGEHKTDPTHLGGGLKSIAPEVSDGEIMAAGFDGHGAQLFDALEKDSVTQKVYMYDQNGNFLSTNMPSGATIDNTNPNMFYAEGDTWVQSVAVNNGGNGYTNGGTIAFSSPTTSSGTTAAGTINTDSTGKITSVNISARGSGYDEPPSYTLPTPGSGADLEVHMGGVPLGAPYKSTDAQSIQASWVYENQDDNTAGDSDSILQLTTGGTTVSNRTNTPYNLSPPNIATTVMWQDIQLLMDVDVNTGNRRRRQFHLKKDVSFHFPIYIEPTRFTGVKTLGAQCTLADDVPAGSTSLPIVEPVGDLAYSTSDPFDKWSLSPSKAEIDDSATDHELFTLVGVDEQTNSLLLLMPTTYNHYGGEPILQNTYQNQTVHSGGKMTSNQYMDDLLPGADAISVGLLVEYEETVTSTVNGPGQQAVVFKNPITDNALNTDSPIALMVNYKFPTPGDDVEVIQPGSYTLQRNSDGAVTGFTATFTKAHTNPFKVTYSRWFRGWWGDSAWVAPFKKDNRSNVLYMNNDPTTNTPVYQVQIGSTRAMKHLGTLGAPGDLRAGEWHDLVTQASKLGLHYTTGKTRRPLIVGCEVAIHTPGNVTPFTVLFDAHSVGATASPKHPAIKDGKVGAAQKNAKSFGDSTFAADMYLWAQKNGTSDPTSQNYQPATRQDGNYYVHWEHDTGEGSSPSTIITHTKPGDKSRHKIWAGPRQDLTSGGVSEDHPNFGIPAWPLIRNETTGAISTAILKDGSHFVGATVDKIAWHHVFFNTNKSGFYVHDPGVQGYKVWVPGYNKVGSQALGASTSSGVITYTIPTSEIKQWQNYWDMSTISSAGTNDIIYNGAYVLVTTGTATTKIDPTPLKINSRPTGNTLVLSAASGGPAIPNPALANNYILGQTMGLAIVTHMFEWGKKKSGGAVLHGPHEDFFRLGQIQWKPDPVTGEIPIKTVAGNAKSSGSGQRQGSTKVAHLHWSHIGTHHHHNLAFGLDSTNKLAVNPLNSDGKHTCTFHAHKLHNNNTQAQIETDKGKFIGALPYVGTPKKQLPVYINGVNPHDYIVYDTGLITGYTPGYYAYRTKGTHAVWYTGSNKPNPAKYAGQVLTNQPAPISQGKCYTKVSITDPNNSDGSKIDAWRFDPHKDDSLGFVLIGRVSEHPDPHTRQYYLEGHKPSSQKTSGKTTGKGSIGKGSQHRTMPHKKRKKKKPTQLTTSTRKKHGFIRHH